jgi:hypothetical protein
LAECDWYAPSVAEALADLAVDAALLRKRHVMHELLRHRAAWEALHDDAYDVAEAFLR